MTTADMLRAALTLLLCSTFWFAGCSTDDPTGPDSTQADPPITEDPGGADDDDPTVPDDPQDPGTDDPVDAWPENLLDESHLVEGLFDWPERDFVRGNTATIERFLRRGDAAVDFTLRDVEGEEHTLARLLAERPVLVVFGSFT